MTSQLRKATNPASSNKSGICEYEDMVDDDDDDDNNDDDCDDDDDCDLDDDDDDDDDSSPSFLIGFWSLIDLCFRQSSTASFLSS